MVQPELGEQLTEQTEKEGFFNRIAPFVRRPEVTIPGLAIASAGLALVASAPAVASEQAPDSGYTIVDAHDQLTGSLATDSFTTPAGLLPKTAKSVAREMQHSDRDWDKVRKDKKKERKVCTTNKVAILDTPQWVCDETQYNRTLRRWAGVSLVLISKAPSIVDDLEYMKEQGIVLPKVKDIFRCQDDVIRQKKVDPNDRLWVYAMNGGPTCGEWPINRAPNRVQQAAMKIGIRW